MSTPKHILVTRFSAMGDVAMIVPVVKLALQQNPGLRITVVSNAFLHPLFEGLEGGDFHPVFLKKQHKGVNGILRLFTELNRQHSFDAVVDLHSVLRSHLLRTLYSVKGVKTSVIDKGRQEKKALTRKEQKELQPLTGMHERYARVFRDVGLKLELDPAIPTYTKRAVPKAIEWVFTKGKKVIGVAPFAQYKEKMYPIDRMKKVVQQLSNAHITVLLFGGGENETAILQEWEQEGNAILNVSGKYSFKEELAIISNLDAMVSMDSANMHLASLFNVPVLSIWGATHPYAGFYGWGQDKKNCIQIDLYCRPCSVFGNKPCYRGDNACMQGITEEVIVNTILAQIDNPPEPM